MKAVFLADAHLKNSSDESYRSLMEFLDSVANINQLYLVGDVFDFWFSRNGRVYEEFIPIIEKLADLHTKGVHVIFCEGNHDFYLESYFSARLGMSRHDRICRLGPRQSRRQENSRVSRRPGGYNELTVSVFEKDSEKPDCVPDSAKHSPSCPVENSPLKLHCQQENVHAIANLPHGKDGGVFSGEVSRRV